MTAFTVAIRKAGGRFAIRICQPGLPFESAEKCDLSGIRVHDVELVGSLTRPAGWTAVDAAVGEVYTRKVLDFDFRLLVKTAWK